MARALAGQAEPSPWWGESHQRILAAARALTWPSNLANVETQACRIVGDEFYERLNTRGVTRLNPPGWLHVLTQETEAALRASAAGSTGDGQQLGALLCGLALIAPPGGTDAETTKLLADHGGPAGTGFPADGCRATGQPLVARDAYGSRFLLVAPFGYGAKATEHWYAWDVDACSLLTVTGAGVFGSAQDALAEWQDAVGPAAGPELLPARSELAVWLLSHCLETGPVWDILEGTEPRELMREYWRLRQRARALTGPAGAAATRADAALFDAAPFGGEDLDPVREAFLGWYTARHGDVAPDTADAVYTILDEWGLPRGPGKGSRYSCSPHRIEMTALLIRDSYSADDANTALRLLPEWTQWCIEQSGLGPDFAARSRAAALTEAAALVSEVKRNPFAEREEAPFRRQE
jgi:hypothetical protein